MSSIVLTTLNARYWHSAFGLRYLMANLGDLQSSARILEFGIKDATVEILARILDENPQILGMGVYIWNLEPITRIVADLKQVRPEVKVILGGPEVSYDTTSLSVVDMADFVIQGEGDLAFPILCRQLLVGDRPNSKVIRAPIPSFDQLSLPYDQYTDEDIAHRVIYVEASRGCPFECEFCLSALDIPVRQAPLGPFLEAMDGLFRRGARQFKFVDRTFNLNARTGEAILRFFLDRYEPGLFLHFEMIPDRLPDSLRELIRQFPPGALQFEIGVQTLNSHVETLISRRQDHEKLERNFRFLRESTGVHLHADLIVGLPDEDLASIGAGFDRLLRLGPQEIQVGMLKRLRGTPIIRHETDYGMVFSPSPPYEILANHRLDFHTIHRLRHFARYWDIMGNSGNFLESLPCLWSHPLEQSRLSVQATHSPFWKFLEFCDWLSAREGVVHGISLITLMERLFEYLVEQQHWDADTVATVVWRDYTRSGRGDRPHFLRPFDLPSPVRPTQSHPSMVPRRQARHLAEPST